MRVSRAFSAIALSGYLERSFCIVARELGVPLVIDTRFRLQHWGLHGFSIEDCRRPSREEPSLKLRLRPRQN